MQEQHLKLRHGHAFAAASVDAGLIEGTHADHVLYIFDEAKSVFEDPNASAQYDVEHSEREDRWRVIGLSMRLRLLSVIYTKTDEQTIRLISARRATKAEARGYAEQV